MPLTEVGPDEVRVALNFGDDGVVPPGPPASNPRFLYLLSCPIFADVPGCPNDREILGHTQVGSASLRASMSESYNRCTIRFDSALLL